jgi:glycosyltransferase involved in cell wall biosynthesis
LPGKETIQGFAHIDIITKAKRSLFSVHHIHWQHTFTMTLQLRKAEKAWMASKQHALLDSHNSLVSSHQQIIFSYMQQQTSIDLVIPCLNEAASLSYLLAELEQTIAQLRGHGRDNFSFGLILVDDGSVDNTAEVATRLLESSHSFSRRVVVQLSRNFGKEAAMLAGLRHCEAQACITMDADLQDPPSLMANMLNHWRQGYKVVNSVRSDRSEDHALKRTSAEAFYWLFGRFSHLQIQFNASDFRLLDRLTIDAILACNESIRFSKGFFAWVGFDQANVYFKRPARSRGESKWGSWRLWNYALDGIFSFSTSPLRIWSYIGLVVTLTSFLLGMTAVARTIFLGIDVPGYASLFTAVTFLGGLQLIGIGILGEYIGRIYIETKRRPQYLIKTISRID